MRERQLAAQRLQEQDKPQPPAGSDPSSSPTSPPDKPPSVLSSNPNSASKNPSPSPSLTSPGLYTASTASGGGVGVASSESQQAEKERRGSKENSPAVVNGGNPALHLEPLKMSNGHTTAAPAAGDVSPL